MKALSRSVLVSVSGRPALLVACDHEDALVMLRYPGTYSGDVGHLELVSLHTVSTFRSLDETVKAEHQREREAAR